MVQINTMKETLQTKLEKDFKATHGDKLSTFLRAFAVGGRVQRQKCEGVFGHSEPFHNHTAQCVFIVTEARSNPVKSNTHFYFQTQIFTLTHTQTHTHTSAITQFTPTQQTQRDQVNKAQLPLQNLSEPTNPKEDVVFLVKGSFLNHCLKYVHNRSYYFEWL